MRAGWAGGGVIYAVMRALVRALVAIVLGRRLRIDGMENIPRSGPALVVGNHVGSIDPVILGINIPRLDVYYMAKSELFEKPFVGWLFRHNHAFPVVRDSPDRTALRRALDILARGHVLLLYPEGTRSSDGSLSRAQAGAGFIARHSGVPIIPVAAQGSDRVLPRGARIPRRRPVHIIIGSRFTLLETDENGRTISNQQAADDMMARVAALLPTGRRDSAGPGRLSDTPPAA